MCLGRVPSHDPDYCWFEKLTTPKSMAERCKVLIGGDFGESRTIQGYQNIKMRAVGQNRLPIGTIRLRVSFVGVRRCIRRRSRSNRRTVEMRTQDGLGRPPALRPAVWSIPRMPVPSSRHHARHSFRHHPCLPIACR